ncbi:MAG: cytochrome c [Pseudomonadota bacterium]|nr:cytochrome c [Pseudomonadota bacterium]
MREKPRIKGWGFVTSTVAILVMASGVAWWSSANAGSPSGKKDAASRPWAIVRVELPASDETFPPGVGADIAASQCLICHSAGMVLQQPPLTKGEWRAEIIKMRSAYGAPMPDDQVDALVEYLKSINSQK